MKPLRKQFLGGLLFLCGIFFHWQRNCQKFLFLLDFFVRYVMMILGMLVDRFHSIMTYYPNICPFTIR